jgi:hypothetical protein
MGLKLTLYKNDNCIYADFIDAYWSIENIQYSTTYGYADLYCYPSREAKYKQGEQITEFSYGFGGSIEPAYSPKLYHWALTFSNSEIFPNGIPLDENEQKTAIYNWVKNYTNLPFEDVLE